MLTLPANNLLNLKFVSGLNTLAYLRSCFISFTKLVFDLAYKVCQGQTLQLILAVPANIQPKLKHLSWSNTPAYLHRRLPYPKYL
jgi:hypothetical protein